MDIGVTMFPTDEAISVPDLARAAEDLGFESLWLPEHTHIPTSRRSPWPGGAKLPREYTRTLDPFVALGAAAAVTERIKLAFGICLVVQRHPITTAKAVASLDHLSGGRVVFGVGAGWNREEMENHGTDPRTRFDLLGERVEAMRRIWSDDEAEYHGDHVDFDPVWSWPKPVQRPGPPVLVGGQGPRVFDRVLGWADGWMPIPARVDDLPSRITELRGRAAEAGRPRPSVTAFGARPDPDDLATYRAAGVDRAVLWLPPAPAGDVLPRLERHARLLA